MNTAYCYVTTPSVKDVSSRLPDTDANFVSFSFYSCRPDSEQFVSAVNFHSALLRASPIIDALILSRILNLIIRMPLYQRSH